MGNEVEGIIRELAMMTYHVTIDTSVSDGAVTHLVSVDSPPNKDGVQMRIASATDTNLHIALTKLQAALMVA